MKIEVKLSNDQPFPRSHEVPSGLEMYYIPGSDIFSTDTDSGTFLLQQINLESFFIAYIVIRIKKEVSFFVTTTEDLLYSFLVLRGNFEQVLGRRIISIQENKFNFFYTSKSNSTLMFSNHGEYTALILMYPKDFILQQLAYYPAFEDFQNDIIQKKSSILSLNPLYITIRMFDCIHQLLHSPYSETTQRFHTDITKRLLKLMLQENAKSNYTESKYSLEYLESIYNAKNYIDNNLLQHYTIYQIARKVGINELKLKKGFKEIFGVGVYGYRKQEKLKIAKAELEQTRKSIKEISRNAGYKNANNFSIAFKKMFDESPNALRKKN